MAAAHLLDAQELDERMKIIVPEYSWTVVGHVVEDILHSIEGSPWDDIAEQLSRLFVWEFENYQPAST